MDIPSYSENLVQLARAIDRLKAAPVLARWMTSDVTNEFRALAEEFDPGCTQFLPHNLERIEHSFKAIDECLPIVLQLFTKMLFEESQGNGGLEVIDGEIKVPEWVQNLFSPIEETHIRQTRSDVAALVALGKKVIWMNKCDQYEVWSFPENIPDSFIEVWWGRVRPYVDGFLIKGDLGWQFYCLEE